MQVASDNLGLIVLSQIGIKPFDDKFSLIGGELALVLRKTLVKMVLREPLAKIDRYAGLRRAKGLRPGRWARPAHEAANVREKKPAFAGASYFLLLGLWPAGVLPDANGDGAAPPFFRFLSAFGFFFSLLLRI